MRMEFYFLMFRVMKTEGPRVNFRERFAHYEIYMWTNVFRNTMSKIKQ